MVKVRRGVFETNSSSEHNLAIRPSCDRSAEMLGITTYTYDDDTPDEVAEHRKRNIEWYINDIKRHMDANGALVIDRLGSKRFALIGDFVDKLQYIVAIVSGSSGVISVQTLLDNKRVEVLLENAKLAAKHLGVEIKEIRFDSSTYPSDGFEVADKTQIISSVDHGVLEYGPESDSSIDGIGFYDILVEPDIEIVYWRNG